MITMIIGQAPSRETVGRLPLDGRLAALVGLDSYTALAATFELANLLDDWPGHQARGKGDRFPVRRARLAAERVVTRQGQRRAILLGRGVAGAFRCAGAPWLTWRRLPSGLRVAVMPHPIGGTRPTTRRKLRYFCARSWPPD